MSRRALVYLRISQDREGAGLGVQRQRKECGELIDRLTWTVVDTYVDNDVSASSGKRRPEYQRLLRDLAEGRGDAVVAWHPDRLHRSPRELEEFIDVVERTQAAIATVRAGDLDLSTPSGRAVARTLGAWARYEVDAKADRTRSKMDELAAAGAFSGGSRPYGYAADGVSVVDDEADVVRAATAAVLTGVALGSIARNLNYQGVPTATGRTWSATQVRQLVVRARNAGLRQHRGQVVGKAAWPALVEEADWRTAVVLLSNPNRRTPGDNRAKWLGAGLYLCGLCGSTCRSATASGRNGNRTVYRCAAASGGGHVARSAAPVDEMVAGVLVGRLARTDASDMLAQQDDGTGAAVELSKTRARLRSVAVDFADGDLDADQLRAITSRLRDRIAALEAALPPRARPLALDDLAAAGERASGVWEALPIADRRAVLDTLAVVTLLPSGRVGRMFRPELVDLVWR